MPSPNDCAAGRLTHCLAPLSVLLVLAAEAFYFRNILGNSLLLGDTGDGHFCLLVAEHWYRWLLGKEGFFSLPIFWPETSALAWSDLLLGFGLPHALFRLMGMDPYTAYKSTLIGLHAAGALGTFFLLRKGFELRCAAAFIGAVLAGSSQMIVPSCHTQLYACAFLPFIAMALLAFFRNMDDAKRGCRVSAGCAAVGLMALLVYTSFYIACFAALFLALLAALDLTVCASLRRCRSRGGRALLFLHPKKRLLETLAFAALSALLLAPFVALELPARSSFGGRSWALVTFHTPTVPQLFNVGGANLMFGWIRSAANLGGHHELQIGWLPTTAALFLASLVLLSRRRISALLHPSEADAGAEAGRQAGREALFLQIALATLIATFIGCKTSGGRSPWHFIYAFIPGMDALRTIARIHVFLVFPAALTCAFGAGQFLRLIPRPLIQNLAALVLCAAAVLACTWKGGVYARWSADWAREVLQSVTAPPEGCAVFAVEDSGNRRKFRHDFEYQLAGWEIANRWDRPTLNGYSGQYPNGWTLGSAVGKALRPRTELWIKRHRLTDVCIYDWGTKTWRVTSGRR